VLHLEAWMHSQASPSGNCSGQSGTETGISWRISVIFCRRLTISAPYPYLMQVSLTPYELCLPANLNKIIRR
jgi:hypothetical protein